MVFQLVTELPAFMELKEFFTMFWKSVIEPCSRPVESCSHLHRLFLYDVYVKHLRGYVISEVDNYTEEETCMFSELSSMKFQQASC
jgi:hypothetical protein